MGTITKVDNCFLLRIFLIDRTNVKLYNSIENDYLLCLTENKWEEIEMVKKWGMILSASVLVLTGCGEETENLPEQDEDTYESETENSATGDGETTITHALGETTLEEKPERIVVLEWVYAENLLALGTQPVGVADIDGYDAWVNVEPELAEDVTDVGTRQEPSLEEIARLEPDLIITAASRHEGIQSQLEQLAPTVMFEPYPEEGEGDQYEEMISTFEEMAKAVGKEQEAVEVLADLEDSYDMLAEQINDAGLTDTEVLLSQAYSANETAVLRLFTDNSMAVQIMEQINLQNAFDGRDFELYGYVETGVDQLERYEDAHFTYIVQEDDNVFENQLKDNIVWNKLNFVQEHRNYALPGDTWTFGGPLSAEVFAGQMTDILVGE